MIKLIHACLWMLLVSCSVPPGSLNNSDEGKVRIAGAMNRVMQRGELSGTIDLDTIKNKDHLYGVGPIEYLKGEITIWDGTSYFSMITPDLQMRVDNTFALKAPFFVYVNVESWKEVSLPDSVRNGTMLEAYLNRLFSNSNHPFAFKISAVIDSASIHVVSLPEGTLVSKPSDAHQGEQDFVITDQQADMIGFFSREHQGVFTHHDNFIHMHLLTGNRKFMGHVDRVNFGSGYTKLFIPTTSQP